MKITLKNVEYSERLSEETSAFSATVYVDGVAAFGVTNHGTGGDDEHFPLKGQTYQQMRAELAKVEAYAKTLPPTQFHGTALDQDAGSLISDALSDHLTMQDYKKLLRTRVVAVIPSRERLAVFKVKYSAAVAATLRTPKYGVTKILNELPFEEAFALLKADDAKVVQS